MNYKKLNEVDIVESMSDSGFVLGVDENGVIKRVPKSTMSKIKTINGVEPDENGDIKVSGGNENLAEVGVTKFVQVNISPYGETITEIIRVGAEGQYGSNNPYLGLSEVIIVNFDGTEYECKVNTDDVPTEVLPTGYPYGSWFGNYSIYDSTKEDTGEPFFGVYGVGDQMLAWWVADNSVEHTAICRTGSFVTGLIPEEYLPCEKPTALTVPYVVETGDNSYSIANAKIGGYTLQQVKELLAKGCSVSFLQTPENAGDEYTAPLLYTLSGGISYDGEYEGEGLVFAAISCTFERESGDFASYAPPAIVGFWWNGKEVKPFTKTLTLS